MTIIDSSGWLEYFIGGPNSDFFSKAIKNNPEIIIAAIILYELWKKISRELHVFEGNILTFVTFFDIRNYPLYAVSHFPG